MMIRNRCACHHRGSIRGRLPNFLGSGEVIALLTPGQAFSLFGDKLWLATLSLGYLGLKGGLLEMLGVGVCGRQLRSLLKG